MATRTVLQLLAKTYTAHPGTSIHTLRRNRSVSTPPPRSPKLLKSPFLLPKKLSQSSRNLRELEYEDEDEVVERKTASPFPMADMNYREPAKEFKELAEEKVMEEEGNPVYKLSEGRSEENVYEVFDYFRQKQNREMTFFSHLQPRGIKPYGSQENMYQTQKRRKFKIVYPGTEAPMPVFVRKKVEPEEKEETTAKSEESKREYTNYTLKKDQQNLEDSQKMSYSTQASKRFPTFVVQKKSSTSMLRTRKLREKAAFSEIVRSYTQKAVDMRRKYSQKPIEEADEDCKEQYVTVKLRDLEEQCRKEKRCKPKKISFGRLPKHTPPDCPCINDIPLKEGKPFLRLKKRFEPKEWPQVCIEETCTTPRADANLKIKPKQLPILTVADCPCVETELKDFAIKRLPKKHIPEPPRVCPPCQVEGECCPPRADKDLKVDKKVLPKLEINNCPCIEEKPLKDVPLKPLKAQPVKEPKKICIVEVCDEAIRADFGIKVVPKILPQLREECICVPPPPMKEGKPFKRLPKFEFKEKPRPRCDVDPCEDAVRADKSIKFKTKKLPVFKSQECPCIEAEIPSKAPKMKRLKPKPVKAKKEVCVKEKCPPRADDGLIVKPKQLRPIEPQDCPCIEPEMKPGKPLKKLVPKPVKEPPRVCVVEVCDEEIRSDHHRKVKPKKLPVLPAGACPCIEPPPIKDMNFKRLKAKPVKPPKRICPLKEVCSDRADKNLKVEPKQLPIIKAPDCPCYEAKPLQDKPLKRLQRKTVKEPKRICPKRDECEDAKRADSDDWLYYKRIDCEVKDPCKREFSTFSAIRPFSTLSRRYSSYTSALETGKREQCEIVIDLKNTSPSIFNKSPVLERKNESASKPTRIDPLSCNRYISTCSRAQEADKIPREAPHLQPRNPLLNETEVFIKSYPSEAVIEEATRKSRKFHRCRESPEEKEAEAKEEEENCRQREEIKKVALKECKMEPVQKKEPSLMERILSYFKAKPNCPSPEEYRKMKLREEAEAAAAKAGLCLYDPKEMLNNCDKELPKVITAQKNECEEEK